MISRSTASFFDTLGGSSNVVALAGGNSESMQFAQLECQAVPL
tara:strand:- start:382 stop:510 length:129 start_codon:yes stop_codon:yes gene_type:complete